MRTDVFVNCSDASFVNDSFHFNERSTRVIGSFYAMIIIVRELCSGLSFIFVQISRTSPLTGVGPSFISLHSLVT